MEKSVGYSNRKKTLFKWHWLEAVSAVQCFTDFVQSSRWREVVGLNWTPPWQADVKVSCIALPHRGSGCLSYQQLLDCIEHDSQTALTAATEAAVLFRPDKLHSGFLHFSLGSVHISCVCVHVSARTIYPTLHQTRMSILDDSARPRITFSANNFKIPCTWQPQYSYVQGKIVAMAYKIRLRYG